MGFSRGNPVVVSYPTFVMAVGAARQIIDTLVLSKGSGYHYEGCVDLSAVLVAANVWVEEDVKGDGTWVEIHGSRIRFNPAGTPAEATPAKHFTGVKTARSIRLAIQSDTGEAAERSCPAYFIAEELTR